MKNEARLESLTASDYKRHFIGGIYVLIPTRLGKWAQTHLGNRFEGIQGPKRSLSD
jgi:hypothetical protein